MVDEVITLDKLKDANMDADSFNLFMNGDDQTDVIARLGAIYPTLQKWLRLMMEAGGWAYYSTEAELLAVTPSTSPSVAYAADTKKLYKWDGSTWIDEGLSQLDLAKEYINDLLKNLLLNNIIHDENGNKYELSVLAQDLQKIIFGVTNNGDLSLGDIFIQQRDDQTFICDGVGRTWVRMLNNKIYFLGFIIDLSSEDGLISITDSVGNNLFRVSEKGTVFANKFVSASQLLESDNIYFPTINRTGQYNVIDADILMVLVYGQSLSRGTASSPAISTTQSYANIMLSSGITKRPIDSGYNATSFIAATEETVETPTCAIMNGLSRRFEDVTGKDSPVFFGASTGDGGKTITQLSKNVGLGFFESSIKLIQDAYDLAKTQDSTFSVLCYPYFQGENDNNITDANASRLWFYAERLIRLKQDFDAEVMRITGQTYQPLLCIYQTAAHRRYGAKYMRTAIAQLNACKQYDDFIMSVPAYCLPHASDLLHLSNEGSWLMGEYSARAIHQTVFLREKWQPLQPSWVKWGTTEIVVGGWNPKGTTLVIDDALCATTWNAGFDLFLPDATLVDTISNVELLDETTIKITLSQTAPTNAILCCGRGRDVQNGAGSGGNLTGARTNIRDNQGDFDKATSPLNNEFSLHNPSVMWQYSRKDGFNAV